MIDTKSFEALRASDSYTDLNNIQSLRSMKDKGKALEEIAKQFESMLVRMMMKSMREANKEFAKDNPFSSHETEFYENMLDDQLALTLSKGRGMGLAETIQRQLTRGLNLDNGTVQTSSNSNTFSLQNLERLPVVEKTQPMPMPAVPAPAPAMRFDGTPQQFIDQLYEMAKGPAQQLGVKPEVLIAQAALETGWGKKINSNSQGQSSHNLFNIKADKRWQGESISVSTLEYRNGVAQKEVAAFRSYASPQQSFDDYVEFIKGSPRYQAALKAGDSEEYIRQLSEGGYATDPNYADKILRILNSDVFGKDKQEQLDKVERS